MTPIWSPDSTTLLDMLRFRAANQPQKTGYTFLKDGELGQIRLTYFQLHQKAQAIAAHLQSLNAVGARVLMLYPPGLDFVEGLFGCIYAGSIAVPAYAPRINRNQSRLSAIAEDSGAAFVLTINSILPKIISHPEFSRLQCIASDEIALELSARWCDPNPRNDSIACLQYTSGSTGIPKGVILTHKNLLTNAEIQARVLRRKDDDVIISWLPMFHDMGFMAGVIQPLWADVHGVTLPSSAFIQRPLRWLKAISQYKGTVSGGPNFAFDLCAEKISEADKAELDLSSWRVAFNGAEPIVPETLERFARAFHDCGFRKEALHPCYGLAEATLMVSVKQSETPVYKKVSASALENNRFEGPDGNQKIRALVSSGAVLPQHEVRIVDPNTGLPALPNMVGEIWVHGASVGQGYWNRPDESTAVFRATVGSEKREFLRTGDLGVLHAGELFVTGRLKDLIIIRGTNHYPQDIEAVLGSCHPALLPGCGAAFSVEVDAEERLVVVQEIDRSFRSLDLNPVIKAIRTAVTEEFELQPYAIVLISPGSICRTSSGKIQRHRCRQEFLDHDLKVWAEWMQETRQNRQEPVHEPRPTSQRDANEIQDWLLERIARILKVSVSEIDVSRPFAEFGLDSKDAVGMSGDLEAFLGCRLSATLLYEHPSIKSLALHLSHGTRGAVNGFPRPQAQGRGEPLAVVGMACRFPGANSLEEFWDLLRDGKDAVTEVPPDRWNADRTYDINPKAAGKTNSRWGGFLQDIDLFDAHFFSISPGEAVSMDPQQRLLMETAWHALEDAGFSREQLAGGRVGTYIGISTNEYANLFSGDYENIGPYLATGNSFSIAANRLAYAFDWRGPSMAVDTACSSSLVAVHLACRALWDSEIDLAVAGGVNVLLSPALAINFSKAGVLSAQGRCKAFDSQADGFVRSEGVGVVVLRSLAAALANGDRIYCVIRGSAVNQDGRSNGLMAPNRQAQVAVLRGAYQQAGIAPDSVQLIEAHGSGTLLGDSIELSAWRELMPTQSGQTKRHIGSVKSNIGHAESAAGVAGLIKTALALYRREIPASLHFERANPYTRPAEFDAEVPTRLLSWPSPEPRIAGVSSFGFGGTNAHVVLEGAPVARAPAAGAAQPGTYILPLSAQTANSLRRMVESHRDFLLQVREHLADICFTAATRRTHHLHRAAFVGSSHEEMARQCDAFLERQNPQRQLVQKQRNAGRRQYCFVFPGHGSQWIGMGQQLLEQHPLFRAEVERCDAEMRKHLDWSVLELLRDNTGANLAEIDVIQPALFAVQVGLVAVWRAFGIEPDAVVGQSMGEILAAYIGGALSFEDATWMVCFRSKLLKKITDRGAMLMTALPMAEARSVITQNHREAQVSVGISSSPMSTVLSGETRALAEIAEELKRRKIFCRMVNIDYASHSSKVDPIREELLTGLAQLHSGAARLPIYSTVTGRLADDVRWDADYWWRNLREPVLVADAVAALLSSEVDTFIEISPHPVLSMSIMECVQEKHQEAIVVSSLQRDKAEWASLLCSVAALYAAGDVLSWNRIVSPGKHVSLPSYAFDRKRFWPAAMSTVNPLPQQHAVPVRNGMSSRSTSGYPSSDPSSGFMTANNFAGKKSILRDLRSMVAELLQSAPEELDVHAPFLEMGADSIILMNALDTLRKRYGVKLSIRDLFEGYATLDALAEYIAASSSSLTVEDMPLNNSGNQEHEKPYQQPSSHDQDQPPGLSPANASNPQSAGGIEQLFSKQLALVSRVISEQLQTLQNIHSPGVVAKPVALEQIGRSASPHGAPENSNTKVADRPAAHTVADAATHSSLAHFVPYAPLRPGQLGGLTVQQQQHLSELTARYTSKTAKSKERTQRHRRVLADNRASAGFRYSIKEILYPIQAERSQGSKIWDVDGNEYIDFTMGFGVNLFGHSAPFLAQAWREQLAQGVQLGPQSNLAGEVAQMISEMTGLERVAFTNSGTEAVMMGIRLARTATNRPKLAIFAGSYHGTYDGVIARNEDHGESAHSVPLAPGILPGSVEEVLVLEYGHPDSLKTIEQHADRLAAVLVEPVQSRRPDLQPGSFLRQLRKITQEAGIALIFDEVITGFRLAPGGAQEWFGVSADIATYGKVLGGGMPIGVIAGGAKYLDAIDGGFWQYGDLSYPQATTTFFAGTFCKHPLAMASARAVLLHLKNEGSDLQQRLNQRTSNLAAALNAYFEKQSVAIRIVHCGSLFRFAFSGNMDLLFYHLLEKGIYIWEGRNLFLSTAHTDQDIQRFAEAVKESILELRAGGFLTSAATNESDIHAPDFAGIVPDKKAVSSNCDPTGGDTNISATASSEVAQEERFPFLEAQKQLWLLSTIDAKASLAYHVSAALQLQGTLQVENLRQALETVFDRHRILRCKIAPDGESWRVSSELRLDLPLIEIAGAADDDKREALRAALMNENSVLFNLTNDPPIRAKLFKLGDRLHVLLLTGHHLAVDGVSMGILVSETGEIYSALCSGKRHALPPASQFADYVREQREKQESAEFNAAEEYWLKQFAKPPSLLHLPNDYPRPELKTYNGALYSKPIDPAIYGQLKEVGARSGCTPFMTFFAAFAAFLHRMSGQDEVIIGVPVADRSGKSRNTVGYCTNVLPIQSRVSLQDTFLDFLTRSRRALLEAFEHKDYPFSQLIRKIAMTREISRLPLVDVIFNLDRDAGQKPWYALEVDMISVPLTAVVFDMQFNLVEHPSGLIAELQCNRDLFSESTMQAMLEKYCMLLKSIERAPGQRVSELDLLTREERQLVLSEWNHTAVRFPRSQWVHEIFEQQAKQNPDLPAVAFGDQVLTYAELNHRSNQLANYLVEKRVGPEVRVGICMERSLEMVLAILGTLKAGGAYVPLDPDYPSERLEHMLEDSRVPVLLTERKLLRHCRIPNAAVIQLDQQWDEISKRSGDNPGVRLEGENLAYVIFTSGSTGRPKGAMNTHNGLHNRLLWMQREYSLTSEDRVLQKTPYSFDVSVWEFLWPLMTGAELVVARPGGHLDPAYLLDVIAGRKISTIHFVPSMLAAFLKFNVAHRCSSLRRIICSGEALIPELAGQCLSQLSSELHNLYGPTEACIDVTSWRCSKEDVKACVPIGRPIANVQTYVLDDCLAPVPVGVTGELYLGGIGVGRGYLNRPDLTAERFVPDSFSKESGSRLYRTGDQARWRRDGRLDFLGRTDHQVKIRGFRIELGDIESALLAHPGVSQTAVVVREDTPGQKQLVAYIVPAGESCPAELRSYLQKKLPAYMVPAAYVELESLPLTANGKLDRKLLPKPDWSSKEEVYIAPRTETERILAEIWAAALKLKRVGVEDNFFELGGDSILSFQIVTRARAAGLQITIQQIFQFQTIARLAGQVQAADLESAADSKPATGVVELTPIQQWFFTHITVDRAHWNLSLLLRVPRGIEPETVELALSHLVEHHDALRLRFQLRDNGKWRQEYQKPQEGARLLQRVNLAQEDVDVQSAKLAEHCSRWQASLDLEAGPLFIPVWFDLGNGERRLLLASHHLIADAVSWRILVEDLDRLCRQSRDKRLLSLPPRTNSFGDWSRALARYAASSTLENQLSYWEKLLACPASSLVRDADGENTVATSSTVIAQLSAEETQALLQQTPQTLHAHIHEVLVTAIARALKPWNRGSGLLLEIEGHGREELDVSESTLDLSRTVGWFTTLYPVYLQLCGRGADEDLQAVKEQLRAVPGRGLGYGVLRYAHSEGKKLQAIPRAEVLFNYLGHFDQPEEENVWGIAPESLGAERSPRQNRTHLLEINSSISNGCLNTHWSFSRAAHQESTIQALAARFVEEARNIITVSRAGRVSFSPSDFPLVRLSQGVLDRIAASRHLEDVYPLSPMQQGILFHTLRAPDSGLYINQQCAELKGRLNKEMFRRAWEQLVRRHSVLRTAFLWKESEHPIQVVEAQAELEWADEDWRSLGLDERKDRIEHFLAADRIRGFNLERPPLMRVALVQTEENKYQLVWTHHHLVLDGWSVALLWSELSQTYKSYIQGSPVRLGRPRPYAEYIAWLQRQDRKAAEDFWRGLLKGFHTTSRLELETIGNVNGPVSESVGRKRTTVKAQTSMKLKQLAQEQRLTMNTVVQASWGLLLGRHSGQHDVVFGATSNGRASDLPGAESMVGLFINTLPVRLQLVETQTLELLQRLQSAQSEAWRYQYSSLTEIQSWSDVSRTEPLFENVLVVENYPIEENLHLGTGELVCSRFQARETTNYPLTPQAVFGKDPVLQISYNTQVFAAETVERLLRYWERLLESMADDPQKRTSEFELLSAEERMQLTSGVNQTQQTYPNRCVQEFFEEQAAKTPDKMAVVYEGKHLSYAELNRRANQLAHYLRRLGVRSETPVALCLHRSLELVLAVLGVLKAGGAYVPLEPEHPAERLNYILEDTNTKVVLTHDSLRSAFHATRARVVSVDREWPEVAQESGANAERISGPENLAYILYTSGSTGKPKGVAIEQRQLWNYVAAITQRMGGAECSFAMVQPLTVDSSVTALYPPLLHGGCVHVVSREQALDAARMKELFDRHQVDGLKIAPSHLAALHAAGGDIMPRKILVIGGESSHWSWMKELQQMSPGCTVFNHYGPTEATVGVLSYRLGEEAPGWHYGSSPLGRPLANTAVYVLDEAGNPAPQGLAGEVYLGGKNIARGYIGSPERTAEKFVPDVFGGEAGARLYRTGDRGRWRSDWTLEFLGRFDDQIKVRGYRIELAEIEAALKEHESIVQVAVVAQEDKTGQKSIVAYVVGRPGVILNLEQLRRHAQQRLPDYMLPRAFMVLSDLPRTSHGKLDRGALPPPEMEINTAYTAPQNPVEELLVEIWAQLLQVERVGVDDNFFELGGHSLLATQVISRVRKCFGIEIPLASVFERPTVHTLAEAIGEIKATSASIEASSRPTFIKKVEPQQEELLLEQLDQMSEDEVDAVIARISASDLDQKEASLKT